MNTAKISNFLVERGPKSSPEFMIFIIDLNTDQIMTAWEFSNLKERDRRFNELQTMDREINLVLCKGKMIGIEVHIEEPDDTILEY